MKQRVIFRKWKDDGDIIACFPDQIQRNGHFMESYMHIGQHSPCDYYHILKVTIPAKPEEYKNLLAELTNRVGYNLRVVKRCAR